VNRSQFDVGCLIKQPLTARSVSQVGADFLIGHSVAQLNDDSLILSFFFFPNKKRTPYAKTLNLQQSFVIISARTEAR
jgi:hypothetical protein